ncbi:ABC transporter ATP-binding protein [Actinocorallia sp. A-T 12471]|uniref:ABC transporter ATP-binding protein n=1 Tax=Actinocorallia sp. A-T 12471 TaxID=3089813 RepID=UPI0029CF9099|nr:ABC transporter ATP-binding protein [Actinocorallia sp. A-T 12471]MDX6741175.1 ABC transporter ATP-binding protein [Actinocorallia sp. A-T 12471]
MTLPAPRAHHTKADILPIASPGTTWRALLRAAAAHRGQAWAALVCTLLSSAGVVASPLLLGLLVDRTDADVSVIAGLLTALALAVLLTAVFTALAQRAVERLGAQVAADLREDTLARALRMDSAVLERAGSGDVASRVTDDVEKFVESVPLGAAVFTAVVTVGVAFLGFLSLDWRLALAFTVVFPIHALALRWYLAKSGPLYARERRSSAERSRVLLGSLHGLGTVRAYRMHALQTERVRAASQRSVDDALRSLGLFSRFGMAMNGAEAVGLSTLLATGFFLVRADAVSVGAVTAAALLFHRLFSPLGILLLSFDDVQRAGAALARVVGVALVPPAKAAVARGPEGQVTLSCAGLGHSYDGHTPVVRDVDLRVPAGTSLAVVGASGAGKTTLAGLLGGAFPATRGTVTLADALGGVAVPDLAPDVLRDWVGIVSQETHVFTGTLREDVAFAAPDRTDAQILRALTDVGAAGWIAALPDGLDTRVGEGEHPLTAAQVQQLALARLLLRDPPVVVLDEATAEAGSAGARDLERAAAALVAGRTAVVVAHRLTQARDCDAIVVMDDGAIVESGTHTDLLARGGRYAALWSAWSGAPEPTGA